jgi:hypothetical protein
MRFGLRAERGRSETAVSMSLISIMSANAETVGRRVEMNQILSGGTKLIFSADLSALGSDRVWRWRRSGNGLPTRRGQRPSPALRGTAAKRWSHGEVMQNRPTPSRSGQQP